jgi:tetratricopeptide (TPR) repeat protein
MQNDIESSSPNYIQLATAAETAIDAGRLEEGITILEQASASAASAGEVAIEAQLRNRLAMAQKRAGQTTQAYETLTRVINLLQHTDAFIELAATYINLCYVTRDRGDLDAARVHCEAALAIFEKIDDRIGMAGALTNLGLLQKDQGQLTQAHATLTQALSLLADSNAIKERAQVLIGLGLTQEHLHDFVGARQHYEQALAVCRQAGDRENEAVTLHNLAVLHDNQGEYPTALDYYGQSLAINNSLGAQLGVADDLSSIAAIYQLIGEPDRARQMHERAFHIYQQVSHRRGQIWSLIDLGILARDVDRFDEAVRHLIEALRLAHEIDDPHQIYDVALNLGDVYLMWERPQDAAQAYATCIAAMESVRNHLWSEDEALGYFDVSHLEAYARMVRLYATLLNDPRQALIWVEKTKSREFLRRLQLSAISRSYAAPPELIAREKQLLFDLRQAAAAIASVTDTDRSSVLRVYKTVGRALDEVWQEMRPYDAEYVALRRGAPLSWEELRKTLQFRHDLQNSSMVRDAMPSRRLVLAEYFTDEYATLLLGVRADFQRPEVVELRVDYTELRRFVRTNFGEHNRVRELVADLEENWHAYDYLIAPIAKWADPEDIVCLVPHGLLHYLPLHTLKIEGRYFIERNPLLYNPSASVLK